MSDRQISSLLDLDPDLGLLLEGQREAAAQRELRVVVHALATGPWDVDKVSGASPGHIGLLVLDGVLAREVLVSDTISTELLGPGDVLRPWQLHDSPSLLQYSVRWNVLARSRIALLDRRFAVQLGAFPEVNAALIDRVNERALRLTVTQAISQLNRVDRRLLALFWHLAERWGRMTAEGVLLPMTLSHRMLGQLIGARRPTVSTALSELARDGQVERRDDGTWLLTGTPVGMPEPDVQRVIPMRRRLLPAEQALRPEPADVLPIAAPSDRPVEPVRVNAVELRTVLERARLRTETSLEAMRAAFATTTQLAQHAADLRAQCQATRRAHQRGAPVNGS